MDTKTIAVVGLGYVGLPLALLADRKGFKVIGIDINSDKVEQINKKVSPFADDRISRELKHASMEATTQFSRVKEASVIIICVPTPVYKNNLPNLEPVENACKGIAPFLQEGQLVVLESTVNPGVCDTVILPLLEDISGLKAGKDFYLTHCPERINPGDPNWDVENIPRVVGGMEPVGLEKALNFYRSVLGSTVKPMNSLKEAEAVKIVENSFRDINIAFVNELAMSFHHLNIDIMHVLDGAMTKPFAFMAHYPGCGVGGHCIPVDPYYLIEYAKKNGFQHKFLSLARRINNKMPEFTIGLLREAFKERGMNMSGAKVAVLGLAYKPDIDDVRDSPGMKIVEILHKYGSNVVAYDPYINSGKFSAPSLEEALKGSQAAVIATAHTEFKKFSPRDFIANGVNVVIDGRNCLAKDSFVSAGMTYKGIGR